MEEYSDYYMWLIDRVDVLHGEKSNYLLLMKHLFSVDYIPILQLDENRAYSGLNLRSRYALEEGVYLDDVHDGPCTVLEMLEALSENIAYDTSDNISRWFWELLHNLELDRFSDENYDKYSVDYILERWLSRKYEPTGIGSPFPLKHCRSDTRNMQIWDQMNAYLVENYPSINWV